MRKQSIDKQDKKTSHSIVGIIIGLVIIVVALFSFIYAELTKVLVILQKTMQI